MPITFEQTLIFVFSLLLHPSSFMPNPISPLIGQLENPADLNLDQLLDQLRQAARTYEEIYVRSTYYEKEFQRELKALLELTGPVLQCSEPQLAYTLQGEALLLARRAARKLFNDTYKITPVRRN